MRIIFIMRSETSNAKSKIRLALTSLEARSSLIDDVNAALAANELAVTMTSLERLERILDLHVNHRSWLAHRQDMPPGCIKTGAQGANWLQAVFLPEGLAEIHNISAKCQLPHGRFTKPVRKILPQGPVRAFPAKVRSGFA